MFQERPETTREDTPTGNMNWNIHSPTMSILLVLSHMLGNVEQKLLGRSRKSLVFLKSNFFGSEKFQVSAHVLLK
jgi:hypothetical protein